MQLKLKYSLPFVTVTLAYRQAEIEISHVLVDTGPARTMFSADVVAQIGLIPEPEDTLLTVRGVGGAEVVFTRTSAIINLHRLRLEVPDAET